MGRSLLNMSRTRHGWYHGRMVTTTTGWTWRCWWWLLAVATTTMMMTTVGAYRMGDTVDTEIAIDSASAKDVLRNQMPRFGVNTKAQFTIRNNSSSSGGGGGGSASNSNPWVTLSFEDGLWGMPTLPLTNTRGEELTRIDITFVYSKSGSGSIQSVRSQPYYNRISTNSADEQEKQEPQQQTSKVFHVKYVWLEEEDVNPEAGQALLYLLVFLSGVYFLLSSCGVLDDDEDYNEMRARLSDRNGATEPPTPTFSVPKWD